GIALAARTHNDENRLADVLHRLLEEDPCLTLEANAATRETVLRGLSDQHLRSTLDKMRERYRLEVDTRPPRIAYRETLQARAEGHYRHKKQTGGAGQFGEVHLRVEPLERGAGFEFASEVVGGAIPGQFIPAVEKGVREACASGAIAGYPVVDVRVVVTDGKHHPVDSKEVAFATAGREAFLAAIREARPVVLEPIVDLDVQIPQDAMGSVTGDLSGRRGRILGTRTLNAGRVAVVAQAPLAELDDYPARLKAMTGGSGGYTLELARYEAVPPAVQKELIAQYRPRAEDA
ncbi:MAG TPA: elongation factor G, partial [Plasticicumulans sp.]|nr:elongation factor G [Plasticicumulans sp.]